MYFICVPGSNLLGINWKYNLYLRSFHSGTFLFAELSDMSICRHFTSDFGPDLEPILNGPHQRAPFEMAYKMGPLLGRGGFGTVYAGERTKDQLPVAIKVIKKAKITQWCKVNSIFYHSVVINSRLPPFF